LRAGVITPHDWLLSLAAVRVASSPSANVIHPYSAFTRKL